MKKIGSSETIRKTTFQFHNYKKNLPCHVNKIHSSFLQWFIGFSEGDASFITSKNRLFFIINQKDVKVLYYIKKNLAFGKVSTYKTYSRFIVADKKNIDRLISIFNGNLILDKTNLRFSTWLQSRNSYSIEKNTCLNKAEMHDFKENAWLSGFIDAEGCFNAQRLQDSKHVLGFRVRLRFILDQKNEICIFQKLQQFLESGVITHRETVENMYRFTTTSIFSHEKLLHYLKKHPLHSFKKVHFLRFSSLLRYIQTRKKIPWQGKVLKRVENLLQNIQ